MAEVKWIEHKGKRILLMDFSNSEKPDILRICNEVPEITAKEPPLSALGIVDVTGSKFDGDISEAFKQMAEKDKPYMKMTAVVGVDGLKMIIFKIVLKFTGRTNLVLKNSREEAKDWLVTQ